jgi:hypothetical protein
MKDFKFEVGEHVQDVITCFKGIVMARIDYLTGCNQCAVGPTKLDKDGKRTDWEYFDENRLVLVPGKKRIILDKIINKSGVEKTGFDGNRAKQVIRPKRF